MISAWYFVAFYSLIWNTIKDFISMKIDDRFNFLAMGATLMLLKTNPIGFWQLLMILGFIIVINIVFKKFLGSGDLSALGWITLGLYSIDFTKLVMFYFCFLFLSLLKVLFMHGHKIKKAPAFYIILISFGLSIMM